MQAMIEFLTNMPFWYWWVFAIGLIVIEMTTGTTYFLWPAAGALVAGLISLSPLGALWQVQFLTFAGVTIALSFWSPQSVRDWLHRSRADHEMLNQRGAQKIGRRAIVDDVFVNGVGQVRLGDTLWLAESVSGENFASGAEVVIERTEGTKLFVASV